jgi:hypothetical protein
MTRKVLVLCTVWLILAVLAGASGMVSTLVPPVPQILLASLILILIALFLLVPAFRAWCLTVNIKVLILFHLTRFVGVYFLVLYSQGRLPYDFAVPGGVGDIIIALAALALIIFGRGRVKPGRAVLLVWNVAGLLDILFVVFTAASLAMSAPGSMRELLMFPLSLLPTYIVPLIIFTHIVIFVRLYHRRQHAA